MRTNHTEHANGLRTWPTLYRTAANGGTYVWEVKVVPLDVSRSSLYPGERHADMISTSGRDGRGRVVSSVYFNREKDGMSNLELATIEAEIRWLGRIRKGYSPR